MTATQTRTARSAPAHCWGVFHSSVVGATGHMYLNNCIGYLQFCRRYEQQERRQRIHTYTDHLRGQVGVLLRAHDASGATRRRDDRLYARDDDQQIPVTGVRKLVLTSTDTRTHSQTSRHEKKRTSYTEYEVDAWALKTEEGRGDRRNVQGELHTSDEP